MENEAEEEITTTLKIEFEESLSDSSIELIQRVLKESLGFNTDIEILN